MTILQFKARFTKVGPEAFDYVGENSIINFSFATANLQ